MAGSREVRQDLPRRGWSPAAKVVRAPQRLAFPTKVGSPTRERCRVNVLDRYGHQESCPGAICYKVDSFVDGALVMRAASAGRSSFKLRLHPEQYASRNLAARRSRISHPCGPYPSLPSPDRSPSKSRRISLASPFDLPSLPFASCSHLLSSPSHSIHLDLPDGHLTV